MVKIRFIHPDKKILPEMSAKVAFLSQPLSVADQSAKVVVPPEALTQRDGRPVVFVIREGKAVQTPIETGPRMGNWVSIRSGLTPGQSVIVSPTDSVRDGLSVSLKK
jgi:multidrug efflux pump subunit AcrA (membrane-fusion protein)